MDKQFLAELNEIRRRAGLAEAPPLGQLYVDPKRTKARRKDIRIKDPAALEKAFRKRFADVDFTVNIYITSKDLPSFEYEVISTKQRLLQLQSRLDFDFSIPSSEEATFILYPTPKDPYDPSHASAWGLTHDLVHAMTLVPGKHYGHELDEIEKTLDELAASVGYILEGKLWGSEKGNLALHKDYDIVSNKSKFFNAIGTMGSARAGYFNKRPEEFTTELMTQWMFSGKVEFTTEWAHTEEVAELLIDELSKIANYADQVFWRMLNRAKGKIFVGPG